MIWRNTVGKKSVLHRMGSSLISEEVKFEQYTLHLFKPIQPIHQSPAL